LLNGKTLGTYYDEIINAIKAMTNSNYGTVTSQIGEFIQTADYKLYIQEREAEINLSRLFYNDTINNDKWSKLQNNLNTMYHM